MGQIFRTKKIVTCYSAFCSFYYEVRSVAVYVEEHITCVVADFSVGVSCAIV